MGQVRGHDPGVRIGRFDKMPQDLAGPGANVENVLKRRDIEGATTQHPADQWFMQGNQTGEREDGAFRGPSYRSRTWSRYSLSSSFRRALDSTSRRKTAFGLGRCLRPWCSWVILSCSFRVVGEQPSARDSSSSLFGTHRFRSSPAMHLKSNRSQVPITQEDIPFDCRHNVFDAREKIFTTALPNVDRRLKSLDFRTLRGSHHAPPAMAFANEDLSAGVTDTCRV